MVIMRTLSLAASLSTIVDTAPRFLGISSEYVQEIKKRH